mgnify:CR=1 FL=1
MSVSNDEMILKLKDQIATRKAEFDKLPKNFVAETSCIYIDDSGEKFNLRVMNVDQLIPLRVRLHMYEMSANDLGIDINDFTVSGFTIDKWMHDIQGRLDEIKRRETEKDLKADEKLLDSLLSEDKKTELALKDIAARLGV